MNIKKKILFAEDDQLANRFAAKYLSNHFDVTAVLNGGEAWDCLTMNDFNCVVLDIEMPVMNGVEVLRKMRESGIDIPVIVVTGRSKLEYAERCANLRVDGYVNKPYSIKDLKERIDDLINEPLLSPSVFEKEGKKLHPKISEAIDYINGNHHRPICVEELAGSLAISYEHFIRIFKKEVGMTPVDYINQEKIKDAKKYLQETSLTIHKVMERAGFNTEQHFFSQFKKITGLTPKEFRDSVPDSDIA